MSCVASESGEGAILPTWTAVDNANVRTTRELMEQMREAGWNLEVCPRTYFGYSFISSFMQYHRYDYHELIHHWLMHMSTQYTHFSRSSHRGMKFLISSPSVELIATLGQLPGCVRAYHS